MKIGDYIFNVQETYGSIDHKYKCSLVDGLWGVGSGNTEYEAMKSCVDVLVRGSLELQKKFLEAKIHE